MLVSILDHNLFVILKWMRMNEMVVPEVFFFAISKTRQIRLKWDRIGLEIHSRVNSAGTCTRTTPPSLWVHLLLTPSESHEASHTCRVIVKLKFCEKRFSAYLMVGHSEIEQISNLAFDSIRSRWCLINYSPVWFDERRHLKLSLIETFIVAGIYKFTMPYTLHPSVLIIPSYGFFSFLAHAGPEAGGWASGQTVSESEEWRVKARSLGREAKKASRHGVLELLG